jgi:hypothetical protein
MDYFTEQDGIDDMVDDILHAITGRDSSPIHGEDISRNAVFSNIFSKLLLAYLIAEIQDSPFLHMTVKKLEEIADWKLESWGRFGDEDSGCLIADALAFIFRNFLESSPVFRYQEIPADFEFVSSDEKDYPGKDGYDRYHEKCTRSLHKGLMDVCPYIDKIIGEDEEDFIASYMGDGGMWCSSFYIDALVIESDLLFEIMEREKTIQTELGQNIIKDCTKILESGITIYPFELCSLVKTEQYQKVVRSYSFSGSSIYDDGYMQMLSDPIYIYDYCAILKLEEQERKMLLYKDSVLNRPEIPNKEQLPVPAYEL